MGIWLEYRCENRAEPSAEGGAGNGCESNRNVGPMAMAATDTREAVLQTLRELDQDARDSGWVKSRDGWVCAYCAGQLGLPKAG